MLAIAELSEREARELMRHSIGFNGGKDEDIKRALPSWLAPRAIGIPPAVVAGLVLAMRDGLLEGEMLAKWPATIEGQSLAAVWEQMVGASGE